eukprot:1996905-Alexandrium_andersonii.AAC.1
MSASLVGSEMCIRDRAPSSTGPTQQQEAQQAPTHQQTAAPPAPEQLPPCLLYTSDAADDM